MESYDVLDPASIGYVSPGMRARYLEEAKRHHEQKALQADWEKQMEARRLRDERASELEAAYSQSLKDKFGNASDVPARGTKARAVYDQNVAAERGKMESDFNAVLAANARPPSALRQVTAAADIPEPLEDLSQATTPGIGIGSQEPAPMATPPKGFYRAGNVPVRKVSGYSFDESGGIVAPQRRQSPGIGSTDAVAPVSGHRQESDELAKMEAMIEGLRPRTKEERLNDFLAQTFLGLAASPNQSFLGGLSEGAAGAYSSQVQQDAKEKRDQMDAIRLRGGLYEYRQAEEDAAREEQAMRSAATRRAASPASAFNPKDGLAAAKIIDETELKDINADIEALNKGNYIDDSGKKIKDPEEIAAIRKQKIAARNDAIRRRESAKTGNPDVINAARGAAKPAAVIPKLHGWVE